MIIYNVTINIDEAVHDEWLQWMKSTHIPDVMRTGLFTESRMLRVLSDDEGGGITYSVQYTCSDIGNYNEYESHHAASLRAEYTKRFKDKFVAFRTLLETVT